jgi:hypothetical protein
MRLFHVTKLKHEESIMLNGIIPQKRAGLTKPDFRKKEGWNKIVWLTNDPMRIVNTQCGYTYAKKYQFIAVEVEIEEELVRPYQYRDGMTYTLSDFEFQTAIIYPHKIRKIHYFDQLPKIPGSRWTELD